MAASAHSLQSLLPQVKRAERSDAKLEANSNECLAYALDGGLGIFHGVTGADARWARRLTSKDSLLAYLNMWSRKF